MRKDVIPFVGHAFREFLAKIAVMKDTYEFALKFYCLVLVASRDMVQSRFNIVKNIVALIPAFPGMKHFIQENRMAYVATPLHLIILSPEESLVTCVLTSSLSPGLLLWRTEFIVSSGHLSPCSTQSDNPPKWLQSRPLGPPFSERGGT
jgi:hypothetical protein